jgi:cytochrome c556
LLKCFPKGGKILFRVDTELAGVNQSAALDQQLQRLQASATWEDNEPILNCDESFTRVAFNGDTLKNLEAVFRGLAGLRAETAKLAEAAKTGDRAAIQAQLGATGKACKGCHDEYKAKDYLY